MVRVYGPALSLDASGSLADAIVFSKWKGRNYVRQLVIPANPQTGPQTGLRAMFKFLSQSWAGLGASPVATWNDRADNNVISPFNAYMGYNLATWRNFLAPTNVDPATRSGSAGVYENEAATAGVRQIDVEIELTTANQAWGVLIFRDTTSGFNTSFANCIAAILTPSLQAHHFIDTPLVPDEYFYNFRGFTTEGLLNAEEGEVSDTVV